VRARVAEARTRQRARFTAIGAPRLRTNADCSGRILEEIATPDDSGLALLRTASETMRLSARGFHRTLKVARTIADLDGADRIGRVHIAEALSYRGEAMRAERAA
jgi:magnesium chelatase family protein